MPQDEDRRSAGGANQRRWHIMHAEMIAQQNPSFDLAEQTSAYLAPAVRASMPERIEAARQELASCCACPRNCKVDRLRQVGDAAGWGRAGVCNTGRYARVASAFPHFGEEDCLRGWNGSGTIFFSMCNLRCVFCQNWDISQPPPSPQPSPFEGEGVQPRAAGLRQEAGRELDAVGIADLMLSLQETGCHNINFVTPEHVVPQIVEAIAAAIERGLRLPIVYNTSAYDAIESLRLMDGLGDVYMPDFKFWSRETAKRLAKAKDYPDRAREAIREMHRQVGELRFGPDGLARRGLLVRHLVMPGQLDEASSIFRWLAEEISPDTYVNIMGQYRPAYEVGRLAEDHPTGASRPEGIPAQETAETLDIASPRQGRAGFTAERVK